ncbi:DUF2267 domain-containing protein [Pseudonocardia acidicola]|uniref:DUF2267 domain-containing protein n=1 Tax=Pseudonocardia acidicola TaxID=2724939 RepID=A0ABX1S9G6_9PSEU|nr:DUF2267 domain-containing protein [Pseudonocardia acidicola]NMH96991.1 DUF2267 domain-containing protein [Pseudonocardia acidicola]
MSHESFIQKVAERAGLSRIEAEAIAHATMRTLSERLTGGEAEDLANQLPRSFREDLLPTSEHAESFGVAEFRRRVAERAEVDEEKAAAGIVAVLATIRDTVTGKEWHDVMGQLGKEFAQLVETTG